MTQAQANSVSAGITPISSRKPSGLWLEKTTLDVPLAEKLAASPGNRRLDPNRVEVLAASIRRGEWMPNPLEPIGISTEGHLIQGQHRCHAVIKTGIAMPVYILRQVDPALILVLDQTKRRTVKDQLDIRGELLAPRWEPKTKRRSPSRRGTSGGRATR